jgi:hypothetical protein
MNKLTRSLLLPLLSILPWVGCDHCCCFQSSEPAAEVSSGVRTQDTGATSAAPSDSGDSAANPSDGASP